MKHKHIENVVLAIVLLVGLASVALIYQINTGKAWLTVPTIIVRQTEPEFCCCKTLKPDNPLAEHYFEPFGQILKDASPAEKDAACKKICEVDHSTPRHPAQFIQFGKCGGGR